ncbi:hypothetical protein GpartN1_g2374.t1 [Galdieria partita]|uniref:ArsA/GET3 Anion-transporting ATPase-like domain-containing protein n=1 Tax=Galdieria partita TaxID=83374 RepID=A0A9C7UP77_9RHOD|nr:hypothetical protein GpartN1_g2374.t1 [Galdieria partita]
MALFLSTQESLIKYDSPCRWSLSRHFCSTSRKHRYWMAKAAVVKSVKHTHSGDSNNKQQVTIQTETIPPNQNGLWLKRKINSPFPLIGLVIILLSVVLRPKQASKREKRMTGFSSTPLDYSKSLLDPIKETSNNQTKNESFRAIPGPAVTSDEALDMLEDNRKKFIIVGGKGGVGKTSMSSALATKFADAGKKTLIISTDPAHSLSDVFDQNLSRGEAIQVIGIDNLFAMEVNPNDLKDTFKLLPASQRNELLGMGDMGLDELDSLFETLPPGFDEAVALVEIIRLIQGDPQYAKYEKIIFDTAPTGHTLRLLSLPDFLDGFVGKFLSMKNKFSNVMNSFKGMFGGQGNDNLDSGDLQELKNSMKVVRDLFRDEQQTEFIVATIPNLMAISESVRLVKELYKERIPVRHLFVNQVQVENNHCSFCCARYKEHKANLQYIREQFQGLRITPVQCFDREIRGLYALRTMANQLFPSQKASYDSSKETTSHVHANISVESTGST